jgi:transcriptional regulator with XRE-family HTH domain
MFNNKTSIKFVIQTPFKKSIMRLSQKQIGRRIAELRKFKGISQEDLARSIKISRPSLAQIELGNRGINILEFQKLSQVLVFSFDDFLSTHFIENLEIPIKEEPKSIKMEARMPTPNLQVNKFKNILLYILERCAGKPNVGEPILYKLLYFSDFNHYELYEEHLTGAEYRKLPYGPVPQQMDLIIHQMINQGKLQRVKTEFQGNPQTRFLPLEKADLTQFRASEKEVIDRVLEQMSDWSDVAISNYAHKDMPWVASKDGETIDYELVFYREVPFSVRNYANEEE